ncbi:sulfurtransferase TusA [Buchnera aphidicola]|uniref:Sulfur carrier protein TusA n=1 Tax=Buchnera aphidicola (Cinara strobi) TaxID=1921549 RepID=A0A3B1E7Y8_9GAMM|nr:sulfurtransferase TusA [Buchnera aphidicola]VAX76707.1 Sulfur carrier protein TusA [Buchnera aphidicola (Cinara strobi)]
MKNKLNLSGLRCPDLIMILRKKIRTFHKGQKILILADDPVSKRDITLFCHFMEHKLLVVSTNKIPYQFIIEIGKKNMNY